MPWYRNRVGESLWYEDVGQGVPLVLLHGWCMSSVIWQEQFHGLQSSFRMIAPDLRGHGRSLEITERLDFERFADDLHDLVRYLELDDFYLLGWSMGAQIALQAFDGIRSLLSGLVLVSATPCFSARDGFTYGLSSNETSGMRLKVERNIQRALSGFKTRMFADGELSGSQDAERIKALLDSVTLPAVEVALMALDSLVNADMRTLLNRIAVPVLIVNGDRDPICLPQASDFLAGQIGTSSQITYPGCGHAIFLSRPSQFNDDIIRFAGSRCEFSD